MGEENQRKSEAVRRSADPRVIAVGVGCLLVLPAVFIAVKTVAGRPGDARNRDIPVEKTSLQDRIESRYQGRSIKKLRKEPASVRFGAVLADGRPLNEASASGPRPSFSAGSRAASGPGRFSSGAAFAGAGAGAGAGEFANAPGVEAAQAGAGGAGGPGEAPGLGAGGSYEHGGSGSGSRGAVDPSLIAGVLAKGRAALDRAGAAADEGARLAKRGADSGRQAARGEQGASEGKARRGRNAVGAGGNAGGPTRAPGGGASAGGGSSFGGGGGTPTSGAPALSGGYGDFQSGWLGANGNFNGPKSGLGAGGTAGGEGGSLGSGGVAGGETGGGLGSGPSGQTTDDAQRIGSELRSISAAMAQKNYECLDYRDENLCEPLTDCMDNVAAGLSQVAACVEGFTYWTECWRASSLQGILPLSVNMRADQRRFATQCASSVPDRVTIVYDTRYTPPRVVKNWSGRDEKTRFASEAEALFERTNLLLIGE